MNNKNMKKAVIDQILLWIVLFTIFVGFLFFLIDYSSALKVKDNSDAVADYIARMYAQNKNVSDIVIGVNNIKGSYYSSIVENDLNCVINSGISNHQVIVDVYSTLVNNFLPLADNNIHSRVVVFNENSEYQEECSLTLSFN